MDNRNDHKESTLRILVVEDDENDYFLARDLLSDIGRCSITLDWVSTYETALDTIRLAEHDVYLVDYRLGERDGLQLLREALADGCKAPLILITGQEDHGVDVEAMTAGAMDYLVKGKIDASLLERSIRYGLERRRVERRLEELIVELERALAEIKTLSGLLPICSSCKSVRDDRGYWSQIETYIHERSDAQFSHGLCPTCLL